MLHDFSVLCYQLFSVCAVDNVIRVHNYAVSVRTTFNLDLVLAKFPWIVRFLEHMPMLNGSNYALRKLKIQIVFVKGIIEEKEKELKNTINEVLG